MNIQDDYHQIIGIFFLVTKADFSNHILTCNGARTNNCVNRFQRVHICPRRHIFKLNITFGNVNEYLRLSLFIVTCHDHR